MPQVRKQLLTAVMTAAALFAVGGCVSTSDTASSATLAPLGAPDKAAPTTTTPPTTAAAGSQTESLAPAPSATTVTTAATATSTSTTLVALDAQTYTILAGDTVYRISRQVGVSASAIASYNNWPDGPAHAIFPGDVIRIPPRDGAGAAVTTPAAPPAAPTTTIAAKGGTYTVVAGDYLTAIARKTGTTVQGIVTANGWADGANHILRPGDVIALPRK